MFKSEMKAMIEQTAISVALLVASGIAFMILLVAAGKAFAGGWYDRPDVRLESTPILAAVHGGGNSAQTAETEDNSSNSTPT